MENSSNGLAATPASSSDEPIRVLIVDDEKVVRDMLVTYLGLEGFSVRAVEDGSVAIDELQRRSYMPTRESSALPVVVPRGAGFRRRRIAQREGSSLLQHYIDWIALERGTRLTIGRRRHSRYARCRTMAPHFDCHSTMSYMNLGPKVARQMRPR